MINNYFKKHKEVILYLFFGGLTTIISIAVFMLFTTVLPLNELIANIISWVIAVLFAFLTNRKWVFDDKGQGFFLSAIKFYVARVTTLLVEEGIIFVFITLLSCNSLLVKISAQIIVIVLNYVLSKIFVFKK